MVVCLIVCVWSCVCVVCDSVCIELRCSVVIGLCGCVVVGVCVGLVERLLVCPRALVCLVVCMYGLCVRVCLLVVGLCD